MRAHSDNEAIGRQPPSVEKIRWDDRHVIEILYHCAEWIRFVVFGAPSDATNSAGSEAYTPLCLRYAGPERNQSI